METPVRLFQMGRVWVKVTGGFNLRMEVLEFKAVLKSLAGTVKDISVFTLSLQTFTLVCIYQHFPAHQNSGAEPCFLWWGEG